MLVFMVRRKGPLFSEPRLPSGGPKGASKAWRSFVQHMHVSFGRVPGFDLSLVIAGRSRSKACLLGFAGNRLLVESCTPCIC